MTTDDNAPAATGASSEGSGKCSDDKRTNSLSVKDVLDVPIALSFCHDLVGDPYVTVAQQNSVMTFPVQSKDFRQLLSLECYRWYELLPPKSVLDQVMELYEAQARFDGAEREVFVRVGHLGNCTYVDLGDQTGRAVEIDSTEYRILSRSPVLFRRSRGMRALPEPQTGGDLNDLGDLLNLGPDDLDLVLIFACASVMPTGPYLVLCFSGEEGSAKSMATRFVGSLLDPNSVPLRGDPKEPRDLLVSSELWRIVTMDNLSSMTKNVADALCRLVSGAGASIRQNYADRDEILFRACRPVIINGIPELLLRRDLADRTLRIECPPIPDSQRRPEPELLREFSEVHPYLLGALFDATKTALAREEEVAERKLALPRLANVAVRAEAAAPALRWENDKAVQLMLDHRYRSRLDAVKKDDVARILVEHAKKRWYTQLIWFDGTATELLEELRCKSSEPDKLPKLANQLMGKINELKPALREAGVLIGSYKEGHGSTKKLTVRYKAPADGADGEP